MKNPYEKIKVYELDFGDTNYIVNDLDEVLRELKAQVEEQITEEHQAGDFTLTVKWMTSEEFEAIPEWS